jgi:hypothetical protein
MTNRQKQIAELEEQRRISKMNLQELRQYFLKMEEGYLKTHRNLYLECLNNKPLKDRKTDQEIRDGLILFHHVFGVCVKNA